MAGAVDNQTGYFAIGAQLIPNVTGFGGEECVQILKFLVLSTRKLETTRIRQAQRLFFRGLTINTLRVQNQQQNYLYQDENVQN